MARTTWGVALVVGALLLMGCSGDGAIGDDGSDPGPDPTFPTEHPRIYLGANRARLEAALAQPTAAAARLRKAVDQWVGGADPWGFQAWNAALLGQLTGDATYCDAAIAAVEDQVASAEARIADGRNPEVAGDSYLAIGDMIGDLALVYDWCFDGITADQRARWLAYANQAVWNVWHHDDARWGDREAAWSGWSVDNPSNNYFYSFLRATMLLGLAAHGDSPDADGWLTQFRDAKLIGELVPTFESDLVGGGSREGTGYGVSMRRLFELYDFWQATTGEPLATRTHHTRASMTAFIHQIVPTLDRFAPTGDQARDATASLFDYQRNYLQELVATFPDDPLAGRAKALLAASSVPRMSSAFMYAYDFLYDDAEIATRALDGMGTAYHAAGIGQLYARSGWDPHATWINLTAGPYTESHAHQDQGALMIYKDGWLAHDAVVHSHSGLTQETTAHGVVRIDAGGDPVRQRLGTTSSLEALHAGDGWLYAAADVTPAYGGNSSVQRVQREVVFVAPDLVIVFDRVRSAATTTQTWQLPTPVRPELAGATATISNAGHTLAVTRLEPADATASVHDYTTDSDFSGGFRLDVAMPGGDQRYLHVLSIDGAATATTAAGPHGVSVTLRDGRQLTASFADDAIGGSLTLDGVTTTLAAGVDELPE